MDMATAAAQDVTGVASAGAGPRLEWVNHASFVLEYDGVRLITDPWIEGLAFNESWSLLSDTRFTYDDFHTITHIWLSHEHPDHFSPPNLRSIPPDIRKNITVLFQHTLDRKVVRFCESLGFSTVVELQPFARHQLSPRLSILCHPFPDDDSWLAISTDHGTILNINDCAVDSASKARAIARLVGPVRVLMTQFSYAQWPGNPDDAQAQRAEAWEKLQRIPTQVAVLKPEYVIPFASFVWFCHDENFALNAEMNGVERVARFIETRLGCKPIVLYPGDRWAMGADHDWRPAAQRYAADFVQRMQGGPIVHSKPCTYPDLEKAFDDFLRRQRKRNNPWLRFIPVPGTTVKLVDLDGSTVKLSLSGMQPIREPSRGADIAMKADNLLYSLRFDWGSSTLHSSGRFTSPRRRSHERFFRFFRIADDNNHGETVSIPWLAGKLVTRGNRLLAGALEARRSIDD